MRFKKFLSLGGLCIIFSVVGLLFALGDAEPQCTPGQRSVPSGAGILPGYGDFTGGYVPDVLFPSSAGSYKGNNNYATAVLVSYYDCINFPVDAWWPGDRADCLGYQYEHFL